MIDTDGIEKNILIYKFNQKPTDFKAYRLFQKYGTNLPPGVIVYLQVKLEKLADKIKDDGHAAQLDTDLTSRYDEIIEFCHELIERGDANGKSYATCAKILGTKTRAFSN